VTLHETESVKWAPYNIKVTVCHTAETLGRRVWRLCLHIHCNPSVPSGLRAEYSCWLLTFIRFRYVESTADFGDPNFLNRDAALKGLARVCRAGMVYDKTRNYDNSFHVGGAMMLFGGLLLCLLHLPQLRHYSDAASSVPAAPQRGDGTSSWTDVKRRRHEITLTVRDNWLLTVHTSDDCATLY